MWSDSEHIVLLSQVCGVFVNIWYYLLTPGHISKLRLYLDKSFISFWSRVLDFLGKNYKIELYLVKLAILWKNYSKEKIAIPSTMGNIQKL